jgi:hypothetical protein
VKLKAVSVSAKKAEKIIRESKVSARETAASSGGIVSFLSISHLGLLGERESRVSTRETTAFPFSLPLGLVGRNDERD